MLFPKLNDTAFPNLDNANPYSYKNEFDYTRWVPGTKIKLCNVLWNSDYSDVVHFDTNILRDKYFNELEDFYTIELNSDHSYVPESDIKIPIPYDVAVRYNYMVVTIPTLPGSSPDLDYEDDEIGIRRWYFFIDSVDYRSPSTTACRLTLDVWTQYQNDIEIKYMMLARGHAPVAYSDVDTYLSNPSENNDYLLAPDITPSNAQMVRDSYYIPFGNGTKYICIASVCSQTEMSLLGAVTHNDSSCTYGTITYGDVTGITEWNNRDMGYLLQPSGFLVGDGDNYSQLSVQSSPMPRDNNIVPNGTYMYAVEASTANAFFNAVAADCPVFLRTIRACFMVDESMITRGTSWTFRGYSVWPCTGNYSTENLSLTKTMFGFPDEYKHLAKLYTFPYSEIEISDNNGNTVTVRVENTGSVVAHKEAFLAFPYLNARIWFDGINGSGSKSYAWKLINNTNQNMSMPNSQWSDVCFNFDIPCYALYMDAKTAWKLDNWWKVAGSGQMALAAYHNSVLPANDQRANAIASNTTMYSNASNQANTLLANTANTANINKLLVEYDVWNNKVNCDLQNETLWRSMDYKAQQDAYIMTWCDHQLMRNTLQAQYNIQTDAIHTNSAGDMITGITGGIVGGAQLGAGGGAIGATAGALLGGAIGGLNAYAQYQFALAHADVVMGADSLLEQTTEVINETRLGRNMRSANYNQKRQQGINDANAWMFDKTQHAKSALINGGERLLYPTAYYGAETSSNGATADLNRNNPGVYVDTYIPSGPTYYNSGSTTDNGLLSTNAGNEAATIRANAAAIQTTGNNNAGWTRYCNVNNAQTSLEAAQKNAQYNLYAAANGKPIQLTPEMGDMTPDVTMRKGVQIRIKTLPNGDIRQIGDIFMRYGYALNQIWNVNESGLCPMNHFCYWKAEDIWVDDRKSSNNRVQQIIINMFMKGVTIWKNPDEIGRISIYENKGDVNV